MMTISLDAALRDVAAIVCLRTLPCVGYAIGSREVRGPIKGVLAALAVVATVGLDRAGALSLGTIAACYAYFAVAGALVPSVTRMLRAGRLTKGAVFVWCASVFFVIPSLAASGTEAGIALALGWDLMLSSYSFCVDVAKTGAAPSLRECMTFLLVNPALVYARRGERLGPPRVDFRGIGRALLGIATFFAVFALLYPAYDAMQRSFHGRGWIPFLGMCAVALTRFGIEYGRQSALASLQIGLLRQMGHVLPERYLWPAASSGPVDFFRRWNTYVGHWMLRYVFWPLGFGLGKGVRSRGYGGLLTGFAVICTFGACGLLHDAVIYGTSFVAGTRMLLVFLVSGALVLASIGCAELFKIAERFFPVVGKLTTLQSLLPRVALWATVIGVFHEWFV